MTPFELCYRCLAPVLPSLYSTVRNRLCTLLGSREASPNLLDVGGRRSHYTIGVPAQVFVSDLPRLSDVQNLLHLGLTAPLIRQTVKRRSNLATVIYDDMTRSAWRTGTFDAVVAVEVLEHVDRDEDFVFEVARVLNHCGIFLMTTPNGDSVRNTNPDHKRHYTRSGLESLLARHFSHVHVEYAIRGSRFRSWGLQSWSLRAPWRVARSALGNVVNTIESSGAGVRTQSSGTRHLIAVAVKKIKD